MRAFASRVALSSVLMLIATLLHASSAAASGTLMLRVGTVPDLINAINEANHAHQSAVIRVSAGHYAFTAGINNPSYGPSVLPLINTNITLIGSSPSETILDGGAESAPFGRVFTVTQSGQLTLENLTVANGFAACEGGNDCTRQGGGAIFNLGKVTTHNVIFTGNISSPVFNPDSNNFGGALLNYEGTMVLEDTTVSGNHSFGNGGGIAAIGGGVTLKNCLIQGNNAVALGNEGLGSAAGSGIFVGTGGSLTVENSTLTGNGGGDLQGEVASIGNALYAAGGSVLIENSAITENSIPIPAPDSEDRSSPGAGGGIYNAGANIVIINSTIGGNVIGTFGGGIANYGKMTLQGVTITDNTSFNNTGPGGDLVAFPFGCNNFTQPSTDCPTGGAGIANFGTILIATSVVAGNNFQPGGGVGNVGTECGGVLETNGHNAIGDSTGCTLKPSAALEGQATHDLENVTPKFGALDENGVPGFAHYTPQSGSPLIHAGGTVGPFCTALDQIGDSRAHNVCDIGAIQFPGAAK